MKWSPDGEILGLASDYGAVYVVDFRNDNVIYTGGSSGKGNSIGFKENNYL